MVGVLLLVVLLPKMSVLGNKVRGGGIGEVFDGESLCSDGFVSLGVE